MSFGAVMGVISAAVTVGSLIYGLVKGAPKSSYKAQAAAEMGVPSSSYGLYFPLLFGKNRLSLMIVWYGDFQSQASSSGASTGGKGGGSSSKGGATSSSQTTTYTYSVCFLGVLCEGPIGGIGAAWIGKEKREVSWDFIPGDYSQDPWTYLTTNHPDQALSYRGLALLPQVDFDLGSSTSLPTMGFEVYNSFITGDEGNDANLADVIQELITNEKYGLGMSDVLDPETLTDYWTYCMALDYLMSPVLTESKAIREIISDWLHLTNAEAFVSQGMLKIRPLGFVAGSANGYEWSPNLDQMVQIPMEDFITNSGESPIKVNLRSKTDIYNKIDLVISDRDNDYRETVCTTDDPASIQERGLASARVLAPEITRGVLGDTLAQIYLERHLRDEVEYEFNLSWKHCLLEPLDLVEIPAQLLGLPAGWYPVRLTTKKEAGFNSDEDQENAQGLLTFTAENIYFGGEAP